MWAQKFISRDSFFAFATSASVDVTQSYSPFVPFILLMALDCCFEDLFSRGGSCPANNCVCDECEGAFVQASIENMANKQKKKIWISMKTWPRPGNKKMKIGYNNDEMYCDSLSTLQLQLPVYWRIHTCNVLWKERSPNGLKVQKDQNDLREPKQDIGKTGLPRVLENLENLWQIFQSLKIHGKLGKMVKFPWKKISW